jgi:hypothetical protein
LTLAPLPSVAPDGGEEMKEPKHVVDRILDDEIKEENYKRLFERACEYIANTGAECPYIHHDILSWDEYCGDNCNFFNESDAVCWQKYFKEEAGE